jgi:PAS domain S-box-containing protein
LRLTMSLNTVTELSCPAPGAGASQVKPQGDRASSTGELSVPQRRDSGRFQALGAYSAIVMDTSRSPHIASSSRTWIHASAVSAVFVALACGGIFLTGGTARVSALWLANGWLLGCMLAEREQRAHRLLWTVPVTHTLIVWLVGQWTFDGLLLASANALELGISYYALRKHINTSVTFFTARSLWSFIKWLVLIGPAVGAVLASAALAANNGHWEFFATLPRRFAAHSLGVAVVMPLVVAALANQERWKQGIKCSRSSVAAYGLLLLTAAGVFSQAAFPLVFLLFPPFLWVVFRDGYLGTAIAVAMIAVISLCATLLKIGPLSGDIAQDVMILQLLLASCLATAYPICALLTRQRELIESLAASEQQLRVVADHSRDMIIQTDRHGVRTYVSPAIEAMLGYKPESVIGGSGSAAIHADDRELFHREEAELASGSDGRVASYRVRHKDGHYIWVEVTANIIRGPDGQVVGWISVTRDISERKRMERMKEQLISTVSHELRTPVTSINGSLGLALSGRFGLLPSALSRLLEIAKSNGQRLALLINDILDLEKMSAGQMDFDAEVTSVHRLLQDAVVANEPYAAQKKVSLRLNCDSNAHIQVDQLRFQQILSNLLSNAAKFSNEGGVVEVGALDDRDACVIHVRDYGAGIPKAFQERLFDRFSQADASDSRCRAGTGLGMAIAKELTLGMGGTLTFDSEEGKGTTFRLAFPAVAGCSALAA